MSVMSERLQLLRNENGISQQKMAENIGTTRTNYKNYESMQTAPPISILIKIAVTFDISIDYLTGRIDERRTISETYDLERIIAFSDRVKELRKLQGFTQEYVAKAIGLAFKSTYVSYERAEKEPSFPRLIALANLFGVSLDYLVGFNEK